MRATGVRGRNEESLSVCIQPHLQEGHVDGKKCPFLQPHLQEQDEDETSEDCLCLSLEEQHAQRLQALGVDLVQVTLTSKAQCV